ncbi:hypothetical protein A3I48_03360 [Candidatus Daviesbacteria bacterium RIFCSPLOWO2_02_FULL_36_7]|uniref:Glycosyl transferase family 1 domain-containing protein n=1 Tax=Candidatus Daviesbacteria bacterium RIFCSPLOWO2_02_FULL_36_7 TaxID=1797792 RepID=A0A1F5MHS2_9BACT|nr:MAG: hypothetical protein A3I48_03360 [Candidatus Daviesbacteria bacterium RIFCSPLOWO2_02_FULL_36_7]
MKIVIDARMYGESGIGRYIRNLIFNLGKFDSKNQYFILLLKKDLHRFKYSENFHEIAADFRWYGVGEQIKLLGLFKELKPDLVHFPHFNVPVFYKGQYVVTIHDLIHQHFSMQRSTTLNPLAYSFKRLSYKVVFRNAVNKACKIIVPSNFVKDQLIAEWKINTEKIIVTPEAVDQTILNLSQKTLKQANIKKPYIFYIGNAHPHKNVDGLIENFLKLKEKYTDLRLVLSGQDHYFWQRIKSQFQHKDIIFTGQISDEELVSLYRSAECFVMPSLEEGFGIPILEAMACCCPVVASKAGALPEVGGDAAIYFDPGDRGDMCEKIDMVLKLEETRKTLIAKGLKRYKEFSWEKLTRQTLEVYEKCV